MSFVAGHPYYILAGYIILHTELLAAFSDRSRVGHWTLAAMTHPTVHGDGYRVSGDPCTDVARALNFKHLTIACRTQSFKSQV